MITNEQERTYWVTYGQLQPSYTDKYIPLITQNNVVAECLLQNEIKVQRDSQVAVPFVIRSNAKTGFKKKRFNIEVISNPSGDNQEKETKIL